MVVDHNTMAQEIMTLSFVAMAIMAIAIMVVAVAVRAMISAVAVVSIMVARGSHVGTAENLVTTPQGVQIGQTPRQ